MVPPSGSRPNTPDQTTSLPTNQNCDREHETLLIDQDSVTAGEQHHLIQAGEAAYQQAAPFSSRPSSGQSHDSEVRPAGEPCTEAPPETCILQETTSSPRNNVPSYRPWKLDWKWITFLVLVETSIIAGIIFLDIFSARNNGIASVIQPSAISLASLKFPSTWAYGLLWTTLPTFIMKLFEIMWTTAVSATADRQPYVDLCRPKSTSLSAKLTILLDYRSYPSLYGWFIAFRNKHGLVGAALLLNLITSLSLVPLTSHLFSTIASSTSTPISTTLASEFNESALTSTTSLRPAIDLANAIHAYGSASPAWMTAEYAFVPFNMTGNIRSGT